ncbi:hypothetical protein ACLMJK_007874 [Lecanora helva]
MTVMDLQSQPDTASPKENGKSEEAEPSSLEGVSPPIAATRRRPWSTYDFKSILIPSPPFEEDRRSSKDDFSVPSGPVTPKRPAAAPRGLSLQMPAQDFSSTSTANLSKRIPVSPKPESAACYPSPASVLPRRSRGLDFSRAATNLHHSTLAESSPESSPVVGSRGGFLPRKSLFGSPPSNSNAPESPINTPGSLWGAMAAGEKSGLSSSVGSSSMMDCESGSSSSDGDAIMDAEEEDTIHMTPHIYNTGKGFTNPFGSTGLSPGGDGVGEFSPAATKLMSYRRAQAKPRKKRWSSSSASGQSSMHSPGPSSPPLLKSIESNTSINGGNFAESSMKKEMDSRRESLSMGTNEMHLSDTEQSDDGGALRRVRSHEDVPIPTPVTPTIDDRRNVIRRAVTRRTNMLPKSKGFARIRAALMEEGAPVDTEVKREAEVVRQVRESDADNDLNLQPSQPVTTASSPNIVPAAAGALDNVDQMSEDTLSRRSSSTFTNQAIKNASGPSFWNNLDDRMRTPPPLMPKDSSSAISEDMNLGTPLSCAQATTPQQNTPRTTASQEPLNSNAQTAAFDIPRKGNKRMRDEDFDPHYLKRRAVSPGLSLQNSPVLPQSPLQRDGGWWGTPKSNRDVTSAQQPVEKVSSNGSTGSVNGTPGQSKRVGLQGMTDTHDGLMNMSIE